MRIFGVIGWQDAGKTGLVERLVAEFARRGLSVSTVKHTHHDVDPDLPDSDSRRHRAAGAVEVILAGPRRFTLTRDHRAAEPVLTEVLARLAPVDLVLVEGYKSEAHPKIEVWRRATGQTLIQPADPTIRAVAADAPAGPLAVPVLSLNDTAAIADFIMAETGLWRAARVPEPAGTFFDTVAIVDWSSSATPSPQKPSADAIWIGITRESGGETAYFRTRHDAETFVTGLIASERAAGRRLLVGFDFPFGYPEGFAARLAGVASARAVWTWLARQIVDNPDNSNNRFAVADRINRAMGRGGPFWGRPAQQALDHLPERKTVDYAALGLSELRAIEKTVPRAQPVWKLYTTGSVGGQALVGLPVIHRLAALDGVTVWPFDPPGGDVVLAEVYPSLLAPQVARAAAAAPSPIRDEIQVRLLSLALWRLARSGRIAPLFDTPQGAVTREEGWILGAGHEKALAAALEEA